MYLRALAKSITRLWSLNHTLRGFSFFEKDFDWDNGLGYDSLIFLKPNKEWVDFKGQALAYVRIMR
jgi:hypothetical protein